MWVIDCSPVPDKAECGRGRQLGNPGEEREGCATGQISTTCTSTLPRGGSTSKVFVPDSSRVQVDDVLQ